MKAQAVSRQKPTAADGIDTPEKTKRWVEMRRRDALAMYRQAAAKSLAAARRGNSDGLAVASNALAGCCIETGVLGRAQEAIHYCRRSLSFNPAFMIPQLNLANTLKEEAGALRRRTDEAIFEYERALAIMGIGCGAFYNNGIPWPSSTGAQGNNPKHAAMAFYNRAMLLVLAGSTTPHRPEEALISFEASLRLDPYGTRAMNTHMNVGKVFMMTQAFQDHKPRTMEALAAFRRAREWDPQAGVGVMQGSVRADSTPSAWDPNLCAQACIEEGALLMGRLQRTDEAMAAFMHALRVAPAHIPANTNAAKLLCYETIGRYDEGVALYRRGGQLVEERIGSLEDKGSWREAFDTGKGKRYWLNAKKVKLKDGKFSTRPRAQWVDPHATAKRSLAALHFNDRHAYAKAFRALGTTLVTRHFGGMRFPEAHEAFARAAFLAPESPGCLVSLAAARGRLSLWAEDQAFGNDARSGGTWDFSSPTSNRKESGLNIRLEGVVVAQQLRDLAAGLGELDRARLVQRSVGEVRHNQLEAVWLPWLDVRHLRNLARVASSAFTASLPGQGMQRAESTADAFIKAFLAHNEVEQRQRAADDKAGLIAPPAAYQDDVLDPDTGLPERLRVGIITSAFRQVGNPVTRIIVPLLRHFDRDRVELYCFDVSQKTMLPGQRAPARLQKRLQRDCDRFVVLGVNYVEGDWVVLPGAGEQAEGRQGRSKNTESGLDSISPAVIAARLRSFQLHVLVELDGATENEVTMQVINKRPRVAHVIVAYLGFMGASHTHKIHSFFPLRACCAIANFRVPLIPCDRCTILAFHQGRTARRRVGSWTTSWPRPTWCPTRACRTTTRPCCACRARCPSGRARCRPPPRSASAGARTRRGRPRTRGRTATARASGSTTRASGARARPGGATTACPRTRSCLRRSTATSR